MRRCLPACLIFVCFAVLAAAPRDSPADLRESGLLVRHPLAINTVDRVVSVRWNRPVAALTPAYRTFFLFDSRFDRLGWRVGWFDSPVLVSRDRPGDNLCPMVLAPAPFPGFCEAYDISSVKLPECSVVDFAVARLPRFVPPDGSPFAIPDDEFVIATIERCWYVGGPVGEAFAYFVYQDPPASNRWMVAQIRLRSSPLWVPEDDLSGSIWMPAVPARLGNIAVSVADTPGVNKVLVTYTAIRRPVATGWTPYDPPAGMVEASEVIWTILGFGPESGNVRTGRVAGHKCNVTVMLGVQFEFYADRYPAVTWNPDLRKWQIFWSGPDINSYLGGCAPSYGRDSVLTRAMVAHVSPEGEVSGSNEVGAASPRTSIRFKAAATRTTLGGFDGSLLTYQEVINSDACDVASPECRRWPVAKWIGRDGVTCEGGAPCTSADSGCLFDGRDGFPWMHVQALPTDAAGATGLGYLVGFHRFEAGRFLQALAARPQAGAASRVNCSPLYASTNAGQQFLGLGEAPGVRVQPTRARDPWALHTPVMTFSCPVGSLCDRRYVDMTFWRD